MINFMLPGFYERFKVNKALIEYYEDNRKAFIDGFNIAAVYGSFQFSIWNGGRIFSKNDYKQASYEDMIKIRDFYKKHNVPVRFTYTNPLITEPMLKDMFSNLTMELFDNNNSEVVVYSKLLEDYIRTEYPSFKIISSTTKRLDDIDRLVEELSSNDYYLVCLDYDLNNRFDLYDKIPENLRSRCEFLINAICPPNCTNRSNHYRLNGVSMCNYGSPFAVICPISSNTIGAGRYRTQISQKDIIEKYVPAGFVNFKLEGRTIPNVELIENYCKYFIKDEYKLGFISDIAKMASID